MDSSKNKMKIEVWSDIMCPFCYIGKRKYEAALAQFAHKDQVELVWKSFQLSPDLKSDSSKSVYQYLVENKGISLQQAKEMTEQVTAMATQSGLVFNFDKSVLANSFDAHRLLHFAQEQGLQNELKEKLFAAYFTEGKNVANIDVLLQIAGRVGLDAAATKVVLGSNKYEDAVLADIAESQQLGVTGVPFFVFDRKYAVSGAQETKVFLQTLERAFLEWQQLQPALKMEVQDGKTCTPVGKCD